MTLHVITPKGSVIALHSPAEFERVFRVCYLSQLQFESEKIRTKMQKLYKKALDNEWITSRQRWLGHYYAQGIRGKMAVDLTIRWIDEKVGYGLWTNRDIPANGFVGEYTGLLRKRRFWGRWKNLYCFDYTVGAGRSSSIVLDCQDFGNHTRFINHSSCPNLKLVSVYCDRMIHVILYANKAIPAGTQLCYDYGEEYWAGRSYLRELLAS
jgi:hypothetical protein